MNGGLPKTKNSHRTRRPDPNRNTRGIFRKKEPGAKAQSLQDQQQASEMERKHSKIRGTELHPGQVVCRTPVDLTVHARARMRDVISDCMVPPSPKPVSEP